MYSRLLKAPEQKSFFLFGPRGTGKTTWVRSVFPHAVYIDLLAAETFNELLANPARLERRIPKGFSDWIIIDEVQRVPELLNEVHRLIEGKGCRFILTGSSARKLRRGGFNLLAGRALTYYMHPLTAIEAGHDFNLENAVRFGQLPSVYQEKDPRLYLESYVKTYLEEEIRQEGITRNLSTFARFLETASFSQGAVLNVSEVAREASIERKVVESYFSALEDLLIGIRLPVFVKKAKRRLIEHRKFYFFDTGVYRAIRPSGPLDKPEEIGGVSLESLFLQNLIAVNEALHLGYSVYYWRAASGSEVDFVLYGERGLHAFEVKRTAKPSERELRGLSTFLSDYPQAKAHFLYCGSENLQIGDISVIPINTVLEHLPEFI